MTEHFSNAKISRAAKPVGARQALSDCGAPGGDAGLPVPVRRMAQHRGDLFLSMVPNASLDMLLLYDGGQAPTGVEAFQFLLRSMCASGRKVDRAQFLDDHISLEVDGIALSVGADRVPDRRHGAFYRPEGARGAARLGYFLYRHQACLRLRVAEGASPDLRRDLLELLLRGTTPKAAVLRDRGIVLGLSEVRAGDPDTFAQIVPGARLTRPVARYARPVVPGSTVRHPGSEPRKTAFGGTFPDGIFADRLALREQTHLRQALRNRAPVAGQGRSGRRVAALVVLMLTCLVWVWGAGGPVS
ncbi:MAG: hypothetical protein GVY34_11285 [Alphaproteobacteria bacterium]|jgi:hypothetical protein|nr:hypothetical protein [Alphaproteobacteria bacterium]